VLFVYLPAPTSCSQPGPDGKGLSDPALAALIFLTACCRFPWDCLSNSPISALTPHFKWSAQTSFLLHRGDTAKTFTGRAFPGISLFSRFFWGPQPDRDFFIFLNAFNGYGLLIAHFARAELMLWSSSFRVSVFFFSQLSPDFRTFLFFTFWLFLAASLIIEPLPADRNQFIFLPLSQ